MKSLIKIVLLFALVVGAIQAPKSAFADKKATEGQNEANVEFYEPTPPKKVDPKPAKIVPSKVLPKTGERNPSISVSAIGAVLIVITSMYAIKKIRVGDIDEN